MGDPLRLGKPSFPHHPRALSPHTFTKGGGAAGSGRIWMGVDGNEITEYHNEQVCA